MRELAPGLWHWTARHPGWTDEDDQAGHQWGPTVSSYAFALDGRIVLIDPVVPAGGLDELIGTLEAVTVLTCPWHGRDAARLGTRVLAPPPDPGDDPKSLAAETFTAGDTLDVGIRAFAGLEPYDLVLWIEAHGALVFGDTLVDLGRGLELPDDWGPSHISHSDVRQSLRTLLDLPIEHALPTHGEPSDRAGFERAVQ